MSMFTLAISWCALQEWNLFLPLLWKSYNQILLAFQVRFPRDSLSLCWSPGWETWHGAQNHHNSGRTSLVLLFSSLWVTLLAGMGFDFMGFDCAPPTISLWLLCLWMRAFFFGGFHCPPVNGCSKVSCNFGSLTGRDEYTSFYSTLLNSPVPTPVFLPGESHEKRSLGL